MKFKWHILSTILMVASLAACHSNIKLDEVANTNRDTAGVQLEPADVQQVHVDKLNNPLNKDSIYFDFDSFALDKECQPILQAHAEYLKSQPNCYVLIQGNTDERGTSEYNLALGQKRAESVRRALVLLGANENQLEAVSLGKEKPASTFHDEASWAQNRRADLIYPSIIDANE
ncbi:peptidoglycan-associated lipoprotein Pal [Candidatus Vallotiella sp. (ex Adelges kitamiensis)]|uniref:peptidoglycan-associated lipoprotein Pal n=1 Tax=Candidatus Vallotiella sp. (ex Adelges kitamiensis) TaxID=2864217 RepID=UPI001CE2D117|nr:peptidoglycan-associated lipoprotein Pal [Candidatus Vallotia sp. (ex Adelges kitamiensis)]